MNDIYTREDIGGDIIWEDIGIRGGRGGVGIWWGWWWGVLESMIWIVIWDRISSLPSYINIIWYDQDGIIYFEESMINKEIRD